MLLYLSYERNRRQWNVRILILLLVCSAAWLFLGFKTERPIQQGINVIAAPILDVTKGEVTVLTYNIAGLPEWISAAKTPRAFSIQRIGGLINDFDIVNIQEDFNYNKFLYQENRHPYRTTSMGGVPFGDGLSTLSKYPIIQFHRVAWKDCNGADCLTPKGFSCARIQLAKDVFLDVYNVHATAQNNFNATTARTRNLQQLASFIQEKSVCQPILLMGDFNAHYSFEKEWIKLFQEHVDVIDTWVLLNNEGRFPEINQKFHAQHALQVTDRCEGVDKIYFRNSDQLLIKPSLYKIERSRFKDESGENLSDHCAVSLQLSWESIK